MSSEEKASNEEQALFEGITRDAARRIASDEARAGHDTGRGSLAAQAAHAAHLNDPAPARAPPEVPVLSVEEAAAVMSHEAQLGHDTGKGSYAAKVMSAAQRATVVGDSRHAKHHLPQPHDFRPDD